MQAEPNQAQRALLADHLRLVESAFFPVTITRTIVSERNINTPLEMAFVPTSRAGGFVVYFPVQFRAIGSREVSSALSCSIQGLPYRALVCVQSISLLVRVRVGGRWREAIGFWFRQRRIRANPGPPSQCSRVRGPESRWFPLPGCGSHWDSRPSQSLRVTPTLTAHLLTPIAGEARGRCRASVGWQGIRKARDGNCVVVVRI